MSPRLPYPEMIPGLPAPEIRLEPSELDIGRQVAEYLEKLVKACPGFSWTRRNSGKIRTRQGAWVFLGDPGTPDYSGHLPGGRAWYLELKKPGARPTNARDKERWAAQERFIAAAASAGCVAFRATSLQEVADRIGKELKG